MKIVRIIGGLGNQMFQYALYMALKHRFPQEKVLVDTSCFRGYGVHNGLELETVFGLSLPRAGFRDLIKVTRPAYCYQLSAAMRKFLPSRNTECFELPDYTYNDKVFSSGDRYYWGYWQNHEYFKDVDDLLKSHFIFRKNVNEPTRSMLGLIDENKRRCVALHVRRGDYLKAPYYAGLCGIDYYRSAISFISEHVEDPLYIVFYDDMEWCRKEILPLVKGREVRCADFNKGLDSPLDMLLMSRCGHNIIANSSFSWWSAFLNQNTEKIVCAPRKWTNTKINCRFQLPEWNLF